MTAASASRPLRFAYADPPYPGQAMRHYRDHPDYAGEVDHEELISRLSDFDSWALSTSAAALAVVLALCPPDVRVAAWCRRDSSPPGNMGTWWWSWEPVIFHRTRPPAGPTRDFMTCSQLKTAPIAGAKPYDFCAWVFRLAGLAEGDEFVDLFPGSGAVLEAWQRWVRQPELPTSSRPARPNERVKALRGIQQEIGDGK